MSERRPTPLEYALLGLLHQSPQSGYDLRKVFADTALGNYSSSPGAIYPALKRLEARGLIDGTLDSSNQLRPRKLFQPTSAGRENFKRWLLEEISVDDVARRSDELMLRFAFHGVLDSAEASREFLETLETRISVYVNELEAQRKKFPKAAPIQSRLALEAGLAQYRALTRWARRAQKQIEEDAR